jgi:hypothetical protein
LAVKHCLGSASFPKQGEKRTKKTTPTGGRRYFTPGTGFL